MGYDVALSKAWQELKGLAREKDYTVRFLNDNYRLDLDKKTVFSASCGISAKIYAGILILHYLIRRLKGLPPVNGEWISFGQLEGGQGYYPVFTKRVIDPILRKYRADPDRLFGLIERFKAKRVQLADISVVLEVFDSVPVLITFWRGDEEFSPELNVLFDKSIVEVFCTEDIVVLSETVAHTI